MWLVLEHIHHINCHGQNLKENFLFNETNFYIVEKTGLTERDFFTLWKWYTKKIKFQVFLRFFLQMQRGKQTNFNKTWWEKVAWPKNTFKIDAMKKYFYNCSNFRDVVTKLSNPSHHGYETIKKNMEYLTESPSP